MNRCSVMASGRTYGARFLVWSLGRINDCQVWTGRHKEAETPVLAHARLPHASRKT